jgi:hypothetical protein
MLARILLGVFVVLHGLVHIFYVGQSRRLFELGTNMVWPDESWAFSKLLGVGATRWLASIAYTLSAIGFVIGGIGILAGQDWSRLAVAVSAILSTVSVLLFWDGKLRKLTDQGLIAILINLALLVVVFILRWPTF